MHKTSARLADGREIIYFDEANIRRHCHDRRPIVEPVSTSELRFDPFLEEWVAIASQRQSRTYLPPSDECPLCPSSGDRLTEIPSESYDVVVFENRFPSFTARAEASGPLEGGTNRLLGRRPATGRCEVVCFTSNHDTAFAALTPERVGLVVEVWIDRTKELSAISNVEQVFCFENRGPEIGVTLHHPHGQIYAYPFVTPQTRRMLESVHGYRVETGGDLFADVLAAEQKAGDRVVSQTEHWTAFVPAAARWPVDIRLYPNRHVPDLAALTVDERDDFCATYLDILRRLDHLFAEPLPYISAVHQAPIRARRDLARLHVQIVSIRRDADKLKYLAGSESIMGAWINDVVPEEIADRLRAAF